ncbi:MAG: (2Fe-2S) ferredoxin domain-containing protein [Betaproteobacteria bacterium]
MRRRLGELFLHRRRDVAARLERLDGARDPDGRFRVNELFCLGSCWQEAVTQLMASAGLVLLDLRGYREDGPYGGGLRYEIQQVFDRVPLARVVVLTQGDNAAAIDRALQTAWSQLALSSPNRALGGPVLRVIELKGAGMREARRVLALLAAAAVPAGAADVAAVPAAPAAVLQPAVPGGA